MDDEEVGLPPRSTGSLDYQQLGVETSRVIGSGKPLSQVDLLLPGTERVEREEGRTVAMYQRVVVSS